MHIQPYETRDNLSRMVSNNLIPKFKVDEILNSATFKYPCCGKPCNISLDKMKASGFKVECPICFSHYEDSYHNRYEWTPAIHKESGKYVYRRCGWSEHFLTVDSLKQTNKCSVLEIDKSSAIHLYHISNILAIISTVNNGDDSSFDVYSYSPVPHAYSSQLPTLTEDTFAYLDSIDATKDFERIMLMKNTYLMALYGDALKFIHQKIHNAGMHMI